MIIDSDTISEMSSVRELTAHEVGEVSGARNNVPPITAKFLIWTIQANANGYDVWQKGQGLVSSSLD